VLDSIAQRRPSQDIPPATHGLWNLWAMMEKYALLFTQATIALTEAKFLCAPFQLKPGETQIPRENVERVLAHALKQIRPVLILTDMESVLPELDRLERLIWPPYAGVPRPSLEAIAQAITNFVSRIQDELKNEYFFHLTQIDVRFYGQKTLFGEKVLKKFKKAAEDIENAGNCLALQQPIACVFHLMRAMEVAVRALSARLKITITPQTTWRQMTGQMDPKIRKMAETTIAQKRKRNDWEAASTNLHHVGSVWRNNTMHPATSYTRSQAWDVLNAVRVFMSGLAEL
jgi:hypothetical protein